jgi:uncharacterized protein (TIGR03083 family)
VTRADHQRIFAAAANERRNIATLVEGLNATQLATPSLCAGWDIKTVAAHLEYAVSKGFSEAMRMSVRRASMARAIDDLARRRAQLPLPEIVANLRQRADRRLSPPMLGPVAPLTDVLIHHGDIRIPLGLPYRPDPELLELALDFLTGVWPFGFVPRGRLTGISLHANDIDHSWGHGPEIRGAGAALMLAAAGRTALLDTLDGPGVPLLRRRLGCA